MVVEISQPKKIRLLSAHLSFFQIFCLEKHMFLYSKTLQEDPETIYEALFSYVLHNFIKTTTIVNKCLFLAKALCQVRL